LIFTCRFHFEGNMHMSFFKFSSVALTLAIASLFGVNPSLAQVAVAQAVPEATTPVDKVEATSRPLNVTIELLNGNLITGTLVEADVINIKTAFGETSPPLSEIAGIRFATREDVTTTIVGINGDSITGATDVKMVTVETDWGTAKINGSSIQSILLIPNLKWQSSNGVSGKRWSLVDSKASESALQGSLQPVTATNPLQNANRAPVSPSSLPAGTYYQNGVLYRAGSTSQE
jgi:hypothetical protein